MSTNPETPTAADSPAEPAPAYAPDYTVGNTAAAPIISGPAPFPIILGLLAIAGAVMAAVSATTGLRINWEVTGPVVIVGSGLVLAALGLLAMRRRD